MKVKEMIARLLPCNPEDDILIGIAREPTKEGHSVTAMHHVMDVESGDAREGVTHILDFTINRS